MSCTLPANTFATRQVKLEVHGDFRNDKGSSGLITFRGKLTDSSGTDVVTATLNVPSDGTRHNYVATLTLTPVDVNQQTAFLALQSTPGNEFQVAGFTRVQSQHLVLDFTAQLDAADPDFEIRRFNAQVQAI